MRFFYHVVVYIFAFIALLINDDMKKDYLSIINNKDLLKDVNGIDEIRSANKSLKYVLIMNVFIFILVCIYTLIVYIFG